MTIFIDVDPNAPHQEDCNFWHGGNCDCTEESQRALMTFHCHECDWSHSYTGSARCNCQGFCICDREDDCPCVNDVPIPVRPEGFK